MEAIEDGKFMSLSILQNQILLQIMIEIINPLKILIKLRILAVISALLKDCIKIKLDVLSKINIKVHSIKHKTLQPKEQIIPIQE